MSIRIPIRAIQGYKRACFSRASFLFSNIFAVSPHFLMAPKLLLHLST